MVNNQQELDLAFAALAHPIRRGILARLAMGEATVAELAKPYKVSAPAITKHLHALEDAGLLSRDKQGREYHCRLESDRMKLAQAWLESQRIMWNERFDRLDEYLKGIKHAKKNHRAKK